MKNNNNSKWFVFVYSPYHVCLCFSALNEIHISQSINDCRLEKNLFINNKRAKRKKQKNTEKNVTNIHVTLFFFAFFGLTK